MNNNIHSYMACRLSTTSLLKRLSLLALAILIFALLQPGKAISATTKPQVRASACKGEIQSAFYNIPKGKWVTLNLKKEGVAGPAWLMGIEDPSFIRVNPKFSRSARNKFFLYGEKIGSTNVTLRNRSGICTMIALSVGIDTLAVQDKLTELLPSEKNIKVVAAADSLVLTGTVTDATAVSSAVAITKAFVRQNKSSSSQDSGSNGEDKIVNLLGVAAPQQVLLEVKVAEINKTLLHKLGMKFDWTTTSGSWTGKLASDYLFGTTDSPVGGLSFTKANGNTVSLDSELGDGLVKILAEPNVMAVSGQEGSFLAGGRVFIPVPDDDGGVTLEEREYGVGIKFVPTVLADGRINIKVASEVSEFARIDSTGTSGLTGSDLNVILPVFTTRRASTTAQLFDGQSFAIGGLIKSNTSANMKALPGLGEIPILGALFRSNDFEEERTELVIVITPRLVKPLRPDYTLPTDNHVTPTPRDLYLHGRLEGKAAVEEAPPPSEQAAKPASSIAPPQEGQATPGAPAETSPAASEQGINSASSSTPPPQPAQATPNGPTGFQ